MAPTAALLLLLLLVYSPDSSLSSPSSLRGSSQQLEGIRRRGAAQVLPRLLSCRVPQCHIGVELANQQPDYVVMAVYGGNVEGSVAAC